MTKALLISFVMSVVLLASCEDVAGPGRAGSSSWNSSARTTRSARRR
jgi:predicted small secreted protein